MLVASFVDHPHSAGAELLQNLVVANLVANHFRNRLLRQKLRGDAQSGPFHEIGFGIEPKQ
jgi:hypothetical protein